MKFLIEPLEIGSELSGLADLAGVGLECAKGYVCDTGKISA
jgi:hypothetical protein